MWDFESSRCHHLLYVAVSQIVHQSVTSIHSDKLAHAQVVINSRDSVAQMCTWEDIYARLFTRVLDDVMSQSELTTLVYLFYVYGPNLIGHCRTVFLLYNMRNNVVEQRQDILCVT